jgi:hypothetical protein
MDDKSAQHVIALSDAQIFDCDERQYLQLSTAEVAKRSISRKFDFNFMMKYDVFNNVEYEITGGS